jgi:hypothetical protein
MVSDRGRLASVLGRFTDRILRGLSGKNTVGSGRWGDLQLKTPTIPKYLRNHTSKLVSKHPENAFGYKRRADKDLQFAFSSNLPADLGAEP